MGICLFYVKTMIHQLTSKRYIPVVTIPTFDLVLLNQKLKPVHSRNIARRGRVNSSRFRRPHLSIVKSAGMAKTRLRMPVPIEASQADVVE